MSVEIGRARTVVIAAGGVAAMFGLYWDDAWHTDVGRDTFFSPPHLLLYGGVAVLLTAIATWAWRRWHEEGWAALRDPVLALPLAGATITLVAAPLDELWHQLFGRDSVVWSPPHMVIVAGMLAFAAGLFLAAHRGRPSRVVAATVGAFLIAAAVTVVMEFEADVPQFPVVAYLPVLVAAQTFVFGLIRRGSGSPWAATEAAAAYVLLRLGVLPFLALLGHSRPTVMPTVVAAWSFDVAMRRDGRRWVAAVATAVVTVGSHAVAHALQPAGLMLTGREIAVGVAVGVAVAFGALSIAGVGTRRVSGRAPQVAALIGLVALGWPGPAFAHDPGQGEELATVTLAVSRETAVVELRLAGVDRCDDWEPVRVVARRAGRLRTGPLVGDGACTFTGSVVLDDPGRWFVYAEVDIDGQRTEAWLPVEGASHAKDTVLYRAPVPGIRIGQIVAGMALYLLVGVILAAVALTYRRAAPGVPISV